jgi:ribosomal protein S18 acetylase RimI-like enzyme
MADLMIRNAAPTDVDGIRSCVDEAYRHYISRIGKPPGPMLADYAAAVRDHQVWVAEHGERIAGVLVLIPGDGYMLLDNIAVHPDSQGQGIGRRLLDFADREAARQGFPELRLYTHQLMTENVDLYRRIGWEETGRGEQDGYPRVFFRKRLTARHPGGC